MDDARPMDDVSGWHRGRGHVGVEQLRQLRRQIAARRRREPPSTELSGVRGRWSDRDAQPVVVDPQAAIESTTVESLIEASHIVTYTAGRGSVRQRTAGVEGRQRVSTQWTGT